MTIRQRGLPTPLDSPLRTARMAATKTLRVMAKQMMEISTSKTVSNNLGNYNSRTYQGKAWTQAEYEFENEGLPGRQYGVRDWSRASLNFEVVRGQQGKPVVQPIDHAKPSLQERWQKRIDEGYKATVTTKDGKQHKKPIKKSEIKMVMFDFGGNRDRMHELAFDRKVNLGKRGIGTNGDVQRKADIEQWAVDCYEWAAKKYGAENIIDFVVHLDETNPHIHCIVVPLTRDGKLSYTELFGGSREQAKKRSEQNGHAPNFKKGISDHMLALHTDFAESVGEHWGLDRGDDIKITGATHKSTAESLKEKNALEEEIAQKSGSVLTLSNRETQLQSRVEDLEEAERRADENLTAKNKMLAKIGIQPVRSKLSIEDENERLAKEKEEALKIAREQKEKATAATRRAETARSEGAEEERRKDIAYDTEGKPMLRKNGTPWTNAEIRDWYSKQHKEDGEKIKALTAKTGLLKGLILPIIEAALDAIRWFFAYPHALNYGIDKDRVQTINEALGMVEDDARNELGKALVGYAASGYEKASHLTIEKLEDEVAMIAAGTHKHLAQGQGESVGLHK